MRTFCVLFFLAVAIHINAQNVGIGTTSPSEKLDVNGNINVVGTIKANGVAGQSNQVLMTSGTGAITWGDFGEFKNRATFTSSGSWTVPASVTRIRIELWGSGGGGTAIAGGGGGGYISAPFTVTPGLVISFNVGAGGGGSTEVASSGGQTNIIVNSINIIANGGGGANFAGGAGGTYVVPAGFTNYFAIPGEAGYVKRTEFFQSNNTTYLESTSGGDGGSAGNSINTGGRGYTRIVNLTTASPLRTTFSTAARVPGGGGASGFDLLFEGTINSGQTGAAGLVSISY